MEGHSGMTNESDKRITTVLQVSVCDVRPTGDRLLTEQGKVSPVSCRTPTLGKEVSAGDGPGRRRDLARELELSLAAAGAP